MKQKYLLSMLLGGAMLAACSTDDDLNLAPVAQEATSAAPVFTVSFDPLTRADYLTNGNKLAFKDGDKLSLFHGATDVLKNYGNAIYEGSQNNEGFTFTTQAMVKEGKAILIWPADTTWANKGDATPVITVDPDQTAETKELTPYISDVMKIGENKGLTGDYKGYEKEQSAGYGRNYKVGLRRAASTLTLNLKQKNTTKIDGISGLTNALGESVEPLKINSVKLSTTEKSFTTAISVISSEDRPYMRGKEGEDDTAEKNEYYHWENQADLDVENVEETNQVAALTTTDVNANVEEKIDTARFTLLPVKSGTNVTGGVVEVTTTYGTVTLNSIEDEVWQKSKSSEEYLTVNEGLASVLKNDVLWAAESNSTMFKNEKMGGNIARNVIVDMNKLKMNNLHIKDEQQLLNVLAVYKHLETEEESVNLILDGGKNGNPQDKFVMRKKTWEAVVEQLNESDNKVSFSPCGMPGEACTTVQLVNDGVQDEEVPELRFGSDVIVELTSKNGGTWKYSDKDKDIQKVTTLEVASGATLTLKGTVNVKANNTWTKVVNNGDIKLDGVVNMQLNMENNGIIVIGEQDRLLADKNENTTGNGAAVIENRSSQDNKKPFATGGYIENWGTLAVVEQSNAIINNFGTIRVKSPDARTLITNNADGGQASANTGSVGTGTTLTQFQASFSKTNNRIGSIILFDKDGSKNNTSVKGNQGFIKLEISETVNGNTDLSKSNIGKYANYLILQGSCANVASLAGSIVKYIEVNNTTGTEVVFASVDINGLIIRDGKRINIPNTATVRTSVLYVPAGEVTKAGTFTGPLDGTEENNPTDFKYEGYYGGDASKDFKNIFVTGNSY